MEATAVTREEEQREKYRKPTRSRWNRGREWESNHKKKKINKNVRHRGITWKKEDEESGFRTRFGSADGGESVPDVGRVVDRQSSGLNDDDGRGDLHRQAPKVHETEQVNQRESDAREDPKDGHQVRDENQRHAHNGRHRQAQVADQFATDHLLKHKYQLAIPLSPTFMSTGWGGNTYSISFPFDVTVRENDGTRQVSRVTEDDGIRQRRDGL